MLHEIALLADKELPRDRPFGHGNKNGSCTTALSVTVYSVVSRDVKEK